MSLRVAELESLFTADISQFSQGATRVETRSRQLDGTTATVNVDANTTSALAGIDRVTSTSNAIPDAEVQVTADTDQAEAGIGDVDAAAQRLVSAEYAAKIDADASKAEGKIDDINRRLDILRAMDVTPTVEADIARAEAQLGGVQSELRAINGLRATMTVEADTSPAESAMADLQASSGDAGAAAGDSAGGGIVDGISDKLGALSGKGGLIVGTIIGAIALLAKYHPGAMIMDAILSDAASKREGLFTAQTGLDAATAEKFGRAAGESYANNFGASIDENLDTARSAFQAGLIDGDDSQREIQKIIDSASTVAEILGEDIPRVTRSAAQAIKTGIAKDSTEAFDILVKGQQAGLNVSEDWLDTLDEYSTQFRKLGLDGPEAMGLISQGLQAGARDTDTVADALKEFSIRAIDGSKTTIQGFQMIGLNAQDMAEKIGKGGEDANEGLGQVLEGLKGIEDPVQRQIAAVDLFGTKAEDLGEALFALDTTTAVEQLGNVAGAADGAMKAIGDNTAARIETAKRSIETSTTGLKNALAEAFAPDLAKVSDWVSTHRTEVTEFFFNLGDAALVAAVDVAEIAVSALTMASQVIPMFSNVTNAVLDFASTTLDAADAATGWIPGWGEKLDQARDNLDNVKESASDTFDKAGRGAAEAAAAIRDDVIPGIEAMHDRFNGVKDDALNQAKLSDALNVTSQALSKVGLKADGSKPSADELGRSIQDVVKAMDDQTEAAYNNGASQDELTADYKANRDALIQQLQTMGLTKEQAEEMADAYGAIPDKVDTYVKAHTADAESDVDGFVNRNNGRAINVKVHAYGDGSFRVNGSTMAFEAAGDILSTMPSNRATVVPPGTLRVVGDRMDVDEAFIPLDGSARSHSILAETMRRMGVSPMADGGVVGAPATIGAVQRQGDTFIVGGVTLQASDLPPEVVEFFNNIRRRSRQAKGV